MSDSEDEFTNDMFTFQNSNMMVSAKGPSFNTSNRMCGLRNNIFSSTMQMPRNFERQRYAESEYGHSSSYRRRETSPMSVMSACDMRQRNFNNSNHPRNQGISQQSILIGRSGSPMSVRSIDTMCSRVSVVDIVEALNNDTFSKRDMRAITEAYRKLMKRKYRNRGRHRRHIPWSNKDARARRKSGYDSGAQASDSSLSSDDNSTKTSTYKDNMSSCRSTKTDMSDFRRNIQDSFMQRSGYRQTFSTTGGNNLNHTQSSVMSFRTDMSSMPANFRNMNSHASTTMFQKDRFRNVMQLPSQRFQKSIVSTTIPEGAENIETDSDIDSIFSESRNKKKNSCRKRNIDNVDDIGLPIQKKPKVSSPCKNSTQAIKKTNKENSVNNNKPNEFVFAKPLMPVRKTFNFKNKEKCISRSPMPSSRSTEPVVSAPIEQDILPSVKHVQKGKESIEDEPSNITVQSERPSFLKRKLFSQKLDIAEQNNVSSDNLLSDSPQNSVYRAIQKEKNKARKLTTQSCLSRDVIHDESNLLDLIHKIVPADQMNVTNQTNKTDLQNSRNKTEDSDKWDISSIISSRRIDEDESDTYTDEEIFNVTVKETVKGGQNQPSKTKEQKQAQQTEEQKRVQPKKGKHGNLASENKSKEQNKGKVQEQPIKDKEQQKNKEQKQIKSKEQMQQSKSKDQVQQSKSKEQLQQSKNKEQVQQSKSKEQVQQSNSNEQLQQSKSKEQVQQSKSKDRVQQSKSKEQVQQSNSNEQLQQSKSKEQVQQSKSKDQVQQSKSKEQLQQIKSKEQEQKIKELNQVLQNKTEEQQKKKTAIVVVNRLPITSASKYKPMAETLNRDVSNINTQQCVKSFWDTDLESDAEFQPPRKNGNYQEIPKEDVHNPETFVFRGFSTRFNNNNTKKITNADNTAKVSLFSNTFDRLQKFNTTLGIRGHRAPKRKDHDLSRDDDPKPTLPKTITKQKAPQIANSEPTTDKKQKNVAQKKSSDIKDLPSNQKKVKTNPQKKSKTDKNDLIKENSAQPNKKQLKSQIEPQSNDHNKQETLNARSNKKKAKNTSLSQSPKNKSFSKRTVKSNKENILAKNDLQPKNNKQRNKKLTELSDCQLSDKKPKDKKAQEENNNRRSCRNKINLTLDDSFSSLNGTLCRSLRSRNVVLLM